MARSGRAHTALVLAAALALAAGGCEKKTLRGPRIPVDAPTAPGEINAALGRLLAAVAAKDAAATAAEIDPELALRVDASLRHAAARPVDQLPIAQAAAREVKDEAAKARKRAEIVAVVGRALTREKACGYHGVALRTPRFPTKPREGWAFVLESGQLIEHVYDTYVACKTGYNVELRYARRFGQKDWKLVAAAELPFGTLTPPPPPIATWD